MILLTVRKTVYAINHKRRTANTHTYNTINILKSVLERVLRRNEMCRKENYDGDDRRHIFGKLAVNRERWK